MSWKHCLPNSCGNGLPAPLPAEGRLRARPGPRQRSEETPDPFLCLFFVRVLCPQTLLRSQEPCKASLLKEQQIVFKCGYLGVEIAVPS